jgi:hypothetical protein
MGLEDVPDARAEGRMVVDGRDPDRLCYHDGLQAALFPSRPTSANPIVDLAEQIPGARIVSSALVS